MYRRNHRIIDEVIEEEEILENKQEFYCTASKLKRVAIKVLKLNFEKLFEWTLPLKVILSLTLISQVDDFIYYEGTSLWIISVVHSLQLDWFVCTYLRSLFQNRVGKPQHATIRRREMNCDQYMWIIWLNPCKTLGMKFLQGDRSF